MTHTTMHHHKGGHPRCVICDLHHAPLYMPPMPDMQTPAVPVQSTVQRC